MFSACSRRKLIFFFSLVFVCKKKNMRKFSSQNAMCAGNWKHTCFFFWPNIQFCCLDSLHWLLLFYIYFNVLYYIEFYFWRRYYSYVMFYNHLIAPLTIFHWLNLFESVEGGFFFFFFLADIPVGENYTQFL